MPTPYRGVFALVNLKKREVKKLEIPASLYQQFIGGSSIAAVLFSEYVHGKPDPLSPENALIFATGPLTGTRAPTSGRYAVAARSPLTGIWGEATSGGRFGPQLKFAGYDGLVLTGAAEKPVYLWVSDGKVELREAAELWGLGTYETMKLVKAETDKHASIACIGPAGENLVRFAAIINDSGRAAARTGLGAVMGSKKVKAIAAAGGQEVPVAKEEFETFARELWKKIANAASSQALRELGTMSYFDMGPEFGDIPAKYFTSLDFDYLTLSGLKLKEEFRVEATACYMCPIGCGRRVFLENYAVDGPEYETAASLGSLNMVSNLREVVLANHMCNDLGLDTISTGVIIAFLNYAAENGFVNLSPAWGDSGQLKNLIMSIAYRQGIGAVLADGVREASRKLGVPEDLAAHVKGLEIPMHDPRAFFSVGLSYITGPRGACHLRADTYLTDMGAFIDEDLGLGPSDFHTLTGKAVSVARMQDLREVYNAAIVCVFSNMTSRELSKLISLATGWEFAPSTLVEVGGRSFTLKRLISNALGARKEDDKLPEIVLKPYTSGPIRGISPREELESAVKEYYELRGWDKETGTPYEDAVRNLGLSEYATKLGVHLPRRNRQHLNMSFT
jgi:aldehyde:ferredoxin oxidoreductase